MKKIVLTLFAVMMGVATMAQTCPMSVNGLSTQKAAAPAAKDAYPTWSTIHTPFTTTDINGNTVSVADTLAAGKYIVIDYSATWCNPCYRFHQSKNLEAIHNQLGSQVCVLWVEADESTTLNDIYGTGSNTQGDWTHYSDGSSVSYPIIDCESCESMIDPTGYVPAVYFVTPSGFYCHIYGETWGLGISMSNAQAVSNIQALIANSPAAGQNPIVNIGGPTVAFSGDTKTFTASVVSVDNIIDATWSVTNGTVVSGDQTGATINFTTAGNQTVSLSVTNTTGNTVATWDVYVRDGWEFGDEMDYTDGGTFESALGLRSGAVFEWGVIYPANIMTGRNYVNNVSAYINEGTEGTYTVRIYQGGETAPNTLLYEAPYEVTQTEQYVDFPILGGVALDPTQSMWVTLAATGYAASYTTYNGDPNGSMLTLNGEWYDMSSATGGAYEGTWMIKTTTSATTRNAFDFTLSASATSTLMGTPIDFAIGGPNDATYAWTLDGATPATANGTNVSASWANPGSYTVTVVGTLNGSNVTKTITVEISDGTLTIPFDEGFEYGLNNWTVVDADGDGYSWMLASENGFTTHSGEDAVSSASYINGLGALTPDNWLISNAFNVPANGATIEWWEYGVDNNDFADHYSVLVSTTGDQPANFTGVVFSGEPTAAKTWVKHSRSLANFAGQNIRIAFRHHDITNMYWLIIDDISVTAGNTASINDVNTAKVDFYPSPVTDKLYISEEVREVNVVDVNGRVVLNAVNTRMVDMSNLSNGVYFVRVITNDGVATKKIVKK